MKFDANATIKEAEEKYGLGKGEYFKPVNGDNKIRLLSAFVPHQGEFNGQPTFKFVAWVLDRADGKVKPYYMPKTIVDEIGALQANPEYAFEEVPMPYDLTINVENAGKKEVEYKVIPARNNTALTAEEQKSFGEKPTIEEYLKTVSEKKGEGSSHQAPPAEAGTEVKVEDVPF